MTILETQQKFLLSEEGVKAKSDLMMMKNSTEFNTTPHYISSSGKELTFTELHMKYLCEHPSVRPQHYLSNLKLMTRRKK